MEQREIILRQKLGKHGYKLKGANERFFVKGTYTDKVASQLDDKKQPIYMTLDEVEKWLNDRINEEKQKEQLWKDKLNKYKSILKYPQYAEWCKDVVFDTLNRFRTKGSKWLINEDRTFIESEVFNPKSELYAFTEYNVSNILDELHIHKFYNMPILEEIRIAFSEIYYKKYEELKKKWTMESIFYRIW